MRVFEVIKGRRSIRKPGDRSIEKKILQKLVEAGVWAPYRRKCADPGVYNYYQSQSDSKDKSNKSRNIRGSQRVNLNSVHF